MNKKYDIFISYRRDGGEDAARKIQLELEKDYEVFLDYDELKDGKFDQRIMNAINEAPVFLLVLTKGTLKRCVNKDDWVRMEITYAGQQNKQIVPVNVDDSFDGFPNELPKEFIDIVGAHQFSEIQTKTLFKSSMRELVKFRIEPYVKKNKTAISSGNIEVHISVDVDCNLLRFNELVGQLQANNDNIVKLPPGDHRLTFVSIKCAFATLTNEYTFHKDQSSAIIHVKLKEIEDSTIDKMLLEEDECNIEEFLYASAEQIKNQDFINFLNEAKKGNLESQYKIGIAYDIGIIPQDYKKAIGWLKMSAKKGYLNAQKTLGYMFKTGHGISKDVDEAYKWYMMAAEQDDARSQYEVAVILKEKGNLNESIKWLHKAAKNGLVEAQWAYGHWKYSGRWGSPWGEKNMAEAYNWLSKAAQQGHMSAMFYTGLLYQNGQGIKKDYKMAAYWYTEAAKKKNSNAQCYLGDLYYEGKGVEKNEELAIDCWKKASKNGSSLAKERLKKIPWYKRLKYNV